MNKKMLSISIIINVILIVAFLVLIAKIGGWNHLLYKIKNRGLAGTYQHRAELFEQLSIKSGDIVFLGNSITQYCEWAELLGNPNIKNRGIAGDGVEGLLKRLPAILTAKPKAIFLMAGVNDLFFHNEKHIIKSYKEILQQCAFISPNTKVIVQSVLPINGDIKTITISNEAILSLNEEIKKLSQEYNLQYIDLHSKFINNEGKLKPEFTVDGIHINGPAYQLWKKVLIEEKAPFNSEFKEANSIDQ